MNLFIPKTYFDEPTQPQLFLCNTRTTKLGELHAYDVHLRGAWNQYSELTFSIDRTYIDELSGESVIDPLFDKLEPPRRIYCTGIGYFSIQDPKDIYSDKDHKEISAFSIEYASASTVYIENFYANNGEIDSIEVTYEQEKYGEEATKDKMYALAKYDAWDSNQQYFHRVYSDSINYTYEQIQIANETVYHTHFGEDIQTEDILYIHDYANVKFYDRFTPELSLLHNIFKKIPEWSIGHVDYSLWDKERKLECERDTVYNVLMNTIPDLFKCHVIWDINNFTVNFYEEEEDGITENNEVQSEFDSDIYISRDNLANEVNISYSADDIKTKLKVSGADDLSIREVNLGKNYIMNLDYYHNDDWMEEDLIEAYDNYLDAVKKYKSLYTPAMQNWVSAYNNWNNLMNAVPAENNVLLVGDTFTKLYCLYSPIDTAYLSTNLTDSDIGTSVNNLYTLAEHTAISKIGLDNNEQFVVQGYAFLYNSTNQNFTCNRNLVPENVIALEKKLNLYHVDEDLDASVTDNVLLTLKNADKDTVTIRVYAPKIANASSTFDQNTQYYVQNVSVGGTITYSRITFRNADEFNTYINTSESATLYKNNYKIRYLIIRASSGVSESPVEFNLTQWVNGSLITGNGELLSALTDYTVRSIGTLGAYMCLAKNEIQDVVEANVLTHQPTEYLKSFGVNLLKTKQSTYTTLFQAQIEEMYAQDKYQCIVSSTRPAGRYPENTRWFDLSTAKLMVYQKNYQNGIEIDGTWRDDNISTSSDELFNYENYQRYIDNYYKLQAVQKVLNEKEKEATYWLSGYAVSNRKIDKSLYVINNGYPQYNGQSLEGDMKRAAEDHFGENTVTRDNFSYKDASDLRNPYPMSESFPLYTFTTSAYPGKTFAVYLSGTTPYVAYADAEDVWQMKMNYYSQETELQKFFTDEQYLRLCPFIREDEYTNENFLLTEYDSEEKKLEIYNELLEEANKELKKISQPKLEFSMNMSNILALPDFYPILNQFKLGNFIRIELRPGLVKRARLLEAEINFNDFSDFSCTFGNLVTTKSEIDRHADLMAQAISAGKQVAAAAGSWSKGADKINKVEQEINNGLQNINIAVGKASGQNIEWNDQGILCRKLIDGTDDQYEDEQIRIVNNKILYSDNSFKTAKSAFGSFEFKGEKYSGVMADAVVGGLVQGSKVIGSQIYGGDPQQFETQLNNSDIILNINNRFMVNKDGEVTIRSASSDSQNQVVTTSALDIVRSAVQYYAEISCVGSTIFGTTSSSATLTCHIYSYGTEITAPEGTKYSWIRNSNDSAMDGDWNDDHSNRTTNTLIITNNDVSRNANFSCTVTMPIE